MENKANENLQVMQDGAVPKKRSSNQLDLLLLKAESYSKFILENQQRAQALLTTHQALHSPMKSTKKRGRVDECGPSKVSAKKRKGVDGHCSPQVVSSTDETNGNAEDPVFRQPSNLRGDLMPHQLEGLQWLLSLWENGLNGILADEMGLGKTIQIIALIAHLREHNTAGPYLIAGPLATLGNWMKEFQKWLPSCPAVLYHGTKPEREEIRRRSMPIHGQKSLDFPIVVTSFELCIADRAFLEKYVWQYIILDEGHRIKNRNCRLLKDLKTFQSTSRLLLTGTPIQNSLEELWSLLNFCSPMIFDDLDVFKSWFDFKNIGQETRIEDILNEEERDRIVTKLHDILRPFVLRRMKKDTLSVDDVQEKREIVMYCGMSSLQKEYYGRVLDGTLRDMLVDMGVPRAKNISQINANMNMRKVCNHPFLFGDITEGTSAAFQGADREQLFISASGKFRLLDRMLPRLLDEGHKVILFSQMTEVLNLIEDYLAYKDIAWVRLDGTTKLAERQEAIDDFNSPNSFAQIFLLSTRAGGLGINLTAADTAILFDSDWNPHMDAQAQSRCHRIGQTENVVVYRFLTLASVEIDMMRRQISKKKLERLAIEGGEFSKAGQRATRRKGLTLEDLKRLLTDDVRRLSSEAAAEGEEVVQLSSEISDAELDMVMDRERIFATPVSVLTGENAAMDEEKEETPSGDTSPAATTPVSKRGKQSFAAKSKKSKSSTKRGGSPRDSVESTVLSPVPLEGDMYDIVQDCGGAGLLETAIV